MSNGWFRCVSGVVLVALFFASSAFAGSVRNLSGSDVHEMIKAGRKFFLLDVRTPEEYRDSRIKGSRLIPIDEVQRRMAEIPSDVPVVVYCAVGSRSSQVAGYLVSRGYPEVYNLYGGIWGWKTRGYPVEQGGP